MTCDAQFPLPMPSAGLSLLVAAVTMWIDKVVMLRSDWLRTTPLTVAVTM